MRIVKPNKFSLVERWEVTGKLSGPWRCWSSCLEYKLSLQWWRINAVLCNGGKILNWSYLSVQSVSRLGTRIEGSCNTKLPASSTRCRRCWTRTWLTRRDSSPAGSCTRPHFPQTTRTAAPACPPPPPPLPPTPSSPQSWCRSLPSSTGPASSSSLGWRTQQTSRTSRRPPASVEPHHEPRTPSWPQSSPLVCQRETGRRDPLAQTPADTLGQPLKHKERRWVNIGYFVISYQPKIWKMFVFIANFIDLATLWQHLKTCN